MALKILDIVQARDYPHLSAQRIHLQIEAMRIAFADVYKHLADPKNMQVTTNDLLSTAYLKERAACIDSQRAGKYLPRRPPFRRYGLSLYSRLLRHDGFVHSI
jgi:gamma-glutamyltranspeptidase/glutathione hydrolase